MCDNNIVPTLYLPKNNQKRELTVTDHDLSHQLQNNSLDNTTTVILPSLATNETTTQISAALSPPIINHNTIVTPIQQKPTRLIVSTARLGSIPRSTYRYQPTKISIPAPNIWIQIITTNKII